MNPIDTAIELAREAGRVQMEGFGLAHEVEYKGVVNIVTEIDKKCEKLIVERLQKEFPKDDILAEEGSGRQSSAGSKWIIDPLDATVNYTHGYPLFGVSIAYEKNGELVLGVVYEPNRDELFAAEMGGGAFLNGRRIAVSKEDSIIRSLLATGFAYNVHEGEVKNNLEYFGRFLTASRAIRRDGMAAGDLCFVACGRFDGFWELYLNPWDIAAGVIIVREAGGCVTNFDGTDVDIYGKEIVASNGLIHAAMLDVLKKGG